MLGQFGSYASIDGLKERFPAHTFTTISLDECSSYGIAVDGSPDDKAATIQNLMSSLPTATSRADFIEVVRRRLILAFAKKHDCDSVLFGDSTTRLAEKTLSETAKGRGVALPWLTADGQSADGITCFYPMRDLLRKELISYAVVMSPPLTPLILANSGQVSTSSKETTIDGLMSQYFESVEENYPSIVANVVRTSGRLVAPLVPESNDLCSLCAHPILTNVWDEEQRSAIPSQSREENGSCNDEGFCYGCERTVFGR